MTTVPLHHQVHQLPLLASNTAFAVIFGIFVVALLVLIVIVLTWAIRRDRAGRAAWAVRQQQRSEAAEDGDVPPGTRP
jgi:ABC-type branched-subunit amino acid transport system permease subunit